jgi:hypothetical protein
VHRQGPARAQEEGPADRPAQREREVQARQVPLREDALPQEFEKVGRTRKLRLRVRFRGNAVLQAGSKSFTLTIRK